MQKATFRKLVRLRNKNSAIKKQIVFHMITNLTKPKITETHVCGLFIQNGAKTHARFSNKIVRERVQFNIQQKMVRKRHDVKLVRKRNEKNIFTIFSAIKNET